MVKGICIKNNGKKYFCKIINVKRYSFLKNTVKGICVEKSSKRTLYKKNQNKIILGKYSTFVVMLTYTNKSVNEFTRFIGP